MEEKKKSNSGLIILVVVLFVVCAIMGAFIFVNKDKLTTPSTTKEESSKKTTNDSKCKEQKVYDVTDESINKLIDTLTSGFDCAALEKYTNDKKVTVNDIDSNRAYEIVMYTPEGWESKDTYSVDEMTKMIQKVLGKDYKFDPSKLKETKGACISHYYDSGSKTFIHQETACGGTCGPHTLGQIVKAVETDGVLELEQRVLFVDKDMTGFYSDFAKTNKVQEIDNSSFLPYKKGAKYKFTFKNEDGNYVFVSSEPVK